jgi:hypothetical protein
MSSIAVTNGPSTKTASLTGRAAPSAIRSGALAAAIRGSICPNTTTPRPARNTA